MASIQSSTEGVLGFKKESAPNHYKSSRNSDSEDGVLRSMTDLPPTHCRIKIQSFSVLTENAIEKYESGDFEVGGYKWKLVLYPNGNKSKKVKEHISLYLAMSDTSSLYLGWEVYAVVRLFLFDQIRDSYLILQDAMGKERRFHELKPEWGFDEFILLNTFKDDANGYLVDDTCVLGAEVFVKNRSTDKVECLSMIKDPISSTHYWVTYNFSNLGSESYDKFIAGDQKWKLLVYPYGKHHGSGSHLSLYLALADPATLPAGSKIFAEFTLRLVDQVQGNHVARKGTYWFSASNPETGFARFVSLTYLHQKSNGCLVRDNCTVAAEVTVRGIANAVLQAEFVMQARARRIVKDRYATKEIVPECQPSRAEAVATPCFPTPPTPPEKPWHDYVTHVYR